MMPKVWNAVMGGIFGARRYCPVCGKRMTRLIAVEEQYIRKLVVYDSGSRSRMTYGVTPQTPGLKRVRQIQVTPVYDICVDCKQRILHRNNKLSLS